MVYVQENKTKRVLVFIINALSDSAKNYAKFPNKFLTNLHGIAADFVIGFTY